MTVVVYVAVMSCLIKQYLMIMHAKLRNSYYFCARKSRLMNRQLHNVILLLAIIMMSFSVSAEKFTFSFVDIITDINDVVENISADTDVELVNLDGRNNFTLTIRQSGKAQRVYRDLEVINYTDDDDIGHFMSFTADDKHVFCFAMWFQNLTAAMIEVDGDDTYYYCDIMREEKHKQDFSNEFKRLKDFCIDESKVRSKKTTENQKVAEVKETSSPQVKAESKTTTVETPKVTIPGLPSEVMVTPLSELKNKILRMGNGGGHGLRFVRDYKELEPLTLIELIEHPLGLKSIGWSDLDGDMALFRVLVNNDFGFESRYKRIMGGIYGPSTCLTVSDKLVLLPPVDFGTFEARWERVGYDKPIIYISYDRKNEDISHNPYFSYEFKLRFGNFVSKSYKLENKKKIKLIKQSFEAFISELKNHGFKIERDKLDKKGYAYSKGRLSGVLSLFINKHMPEYSELKLTIQCVE